MTAVSVRKGDWISRKSERAQRESKNPLFFLRVGSAFNRFFPKVMFSTIVAHMLKYGKTVFAVEDTCYFLAMRPLDRANEFFIGGYVQDISDS